MDSKIIAFETKRRKAFFFPTCPIGSTRFDYSWKEIFVLPQLGVFDLWKEDHISFLYTKIEKYGRNGSR